MNNPPKILLAEDDDFAAAAAAETLSSDYDLRRVSKKCDEKTITKQEKAELDRTFGKDGDMTEKLYEGFMKLINAK